MRKIDEAIIHTTATTRDWMKDATPQEQVNEIRRWHVKDRGWRDIGYHYVIARDGTVVVGRPIELIGAHVRGHNEGTVGIALVGGYGSEPHDQFDAHYTEKQNVALRKLLAELKQRYGITKVSGHNEYANKACPGFYVPAWYKTETVEPEDTPTEGKSTDWYRWRLAELRDLAQKALEDGNKP
jgi:hypothetical protein